MTVEDFDRLEQEHPRIKVQLLRNLCVALCGNLRKANRERSVFD
jgi:glutaminase